jgi:alkylated DNA repair protein alkB homolog 8
VGNDAPTGRLFVTHFGNGDEADQQLVFEYASQFGTIRQITILPGTNYGHLVLNSVESASALIKSLSDTNATLFKGRTLVFFHTPLTKDDLKRNAVIDFPEAQVAKTGSVRGLFIFDDFVTEDEDATLVKALDQGEWEKLLNRRVQHFGFEFKYGTNDVDPDKSMGKFPEFVEFLEPRK